MGWSDGVLALPKAHTRETFRPDEEISEQACSTSASDVRCPSHQELVPAKYWGFPSMLKTLPSTLGTEVDFLPQDGAAKAVEVKREAATAKEVKCFMAKSDL